MRRIKILGENVKKYRTRTVKRTYWSKKKQEYVTKIYKYQGYKTVTRGQKFVVKHGKVTKYGEQLKRSLINQLGEGWRAKVESKMAARDDLRESTLISQLEVALADLESGQLDLSEKDKISRKKLRAYIYNMGGDAEDLARDLGISVKDLLNPANWTFKNDEDATFTFNGRVYEFYFKYKENTISWNSRKA